MTKKSNFIRIAQRCKLRTLTLSLKTYEHIRKNFALFTLTVLLFSFGVYLGVFRYQTYLDGFDFSVFHQAIWKYAHLHYPDSTIRGLNNIHGDHFHPIIILIAPFYALFQSPYTLIIIQSLFITLSILPIYLFAKTAFQQNKSLSLLFTFLYALSQGLQWMLFFDFHEVLFAVPLIAFAIYFIQQRNWRYLLYSLGGLALVKEEMYLFIFAVGFLLLITRKKSKLGILIAAGGAIGFVLLNQVIMPLLAGPRSYAYWSYTAYGQSLSDAIKNVLTHPIHSLGLMKSDFLSKDAVVTLTLWFKPFMYFLPLISPYFLLAIPFLLTRFLSDHGSYSVYYFHYGAVIAPIIAASSADSLSKLMRMLQKTKLMPQSIIRFGLCVVVLCLMISVSVGERIKAPLTFVDEIAKGNLSTNMRSVYNSEKSMLQIVGDRTSVIAPDTIAAHLANRDRIYILRPLASWDSTSDKLINPIPIERVHFVVLNKNIPLPDAEGSLRLNRQYFPVYNAELAKRGFKKVYSDNGGWVVFENRNFK